MTNSQGYPSGGPHDLGNDPTFLSTFDLDSRYPIFSTFCDCLSIAEIVSLTRTCKKFSGLYQHLLPLHWDIDKLLRCYVDDSKGFRSQMARCDAVIGGTFALRYFERVNWGGPLEVLVQQGLGPELFSKYLSDTAGYSKPRAKNYPNGFASQTFQNDDDSKPKILLHTTNCPPAHFILRCYEFTLEVNILSWNKAYSVFPMPAYIQRNSYLLKEWGEIAGVREWLRFTCQTGWNVKGVMWPEEQRCNHPIRERRRVGDRYTWTIPFDTRNVEPSKTPDYVLEHACFKIDLSMSYDDDKSYDYAQEDVRHYTIKANTLESRVLKHTYLYGDVDMMNFISPRLHSSTMLELRKLDPAQRPANYLEMLRNRGDIDRALGDFDRPATWTYRDNEFSTWYKAFERYKPE